MLNLVKTIFYIILIILLITKNAISEIVTLSDGTKIDLKSDGTFVVVSDDETINISQSQKSILNMLDFSNIEYEHILSTDRNSIILQDIKWNDSELFQTISKLEIVGLNQEYFNKFNINSFSEYKGKLFEKLYVEDWKIYENNDVFNIEYFEIENFDHKLIHKIDYTKASSFFKFIDGLIIDRVLIKNVFFNDKSNNTEFIKFSLDITDLENLNIDSFKISNIDFKIDEFQLFSELLSIDGLELNNNIFTNINWENPNPENLFQLFEPINKVEIINTNFFIIHNDIKFDISEIITQNEDFEYFNGRKIPIKGKFEIKNLRVDSISDSNLIFEEFKNSLGSENFIFDTLSNYYWNIDKGQIDTNIYLNIGNSFSVNLDFLLSNFNRDLYLNSELYDIDDDKVFDNLLNLKLDELLLYFENNGLIENIYEFASKNQNTSVSELKTSLNNDLLFNNIFLNFIDEEILTELSKFITDPNNLKITIDPNPNLTLLQMIGLAENPEVLIDILNINFKSNY